MFILLSRIRNRSDIVQEVQNNVHPAEDVGIFEIFKAGRHNRNEDRSWSYKHRCWAAEIADLQLMK